MGGQKFWILWQAWTDSHSCPLPWWGIRNSECFYNHEQIAVIVPCHDGGSEILNPCGIKDRLLFCSVKLWAGGSEIHMKWHNLMELENWMCCFLWTQLNTFFLLLISENLSETQTFSTSNISTLLNFPKLESHILVWSFETTKYRKRLQKKRTNPVRDSGDCDEKRKPKENKFKLIPEYKHSVLIIRRSRPRSPSSKQNTAGNVNNRTEFE